MASFIFDQYAEMLHGNGTFADFKDDTIKVRAVSDSDWTPDRTATAMTAITAYSGSTDGTLATKTVGSVSARTSDAADTALGSFSQDGVKTIDGLVIYKDDGANGIPMYYIDLSSPGTPTGGAVTVQWNASGIATIGS